MLQSTQGCSAKKRSVGTSGVTKAFNHGQNLTKGVPQATVGGQLVNTQKKS